MRLKTASLLLLCVAGMIGIGVSQNKGPSKTALTYNSAVILFNEAEKIAADDPDGAAVKRYEDLSNHALVLFEQVIKLKQKAPPDIVLFNSYLKAGLIRYYSDSLPQAKFYFLHALALRQALPKAEDSLFFRPALFTGSIFYSSNVFDSANIFYKQAEAVADKYTVALAEEERLYNKMGAFHYETGNYGLADNYFQKAIALLPESNPAYRDLFVNFKMNIASTLINREAYQQADTVFRSILRFGMHTNEIKHNLGIIRLRTGRPHEALAYFRQIAYTAGSPLMNLYLNKAEAFNMLRQKDSARFYALAAEKDNVGSRKNINAALLLKFLAEQKMQDSDIAGAISMYQKAIVQLYASFNNGDPYANPEKYSGVFSYILLFQTLTAKADAFNLLYAKNKKVKDIQASLAAYRSAFSLADHVAKNYSSEEARLFLNKIKYAVHDQALQTALKVYELTGDKKYAEEAYYFDQRNKAAVLTLAIQENELQQKKGISATLLTEQVAIRADITRLSLKAVHAADSVAIAGYNAAIRDKEFALAAVQEKLNGNAAYAALQPADQIPSAAQLRGLLDKKTVLLSYHLSENYIIIFVATEAGLNYIKQPSDSSFFQHIKALGTALHIVAGEERYGGNKAAAKLYNILIRPAAAFLKTAERLVIIPDDELNAIPFEALQDENGDYLLQQYAVQYQFSTAFLKKDKLKQQAAGNTLAFAPFASAPAGRFPALPGSKDEITGLEGKLFIDAAALKKKFTALANHYRIVQLATHASANDSFPERSFIAFYPQSADTNAGILYAREIYDLRLDSTDLIILSACETGSGRLIHGEGLMSLSRGFSYAGCPNIITSLWKANDISTAYITKRFHFYLDKGRSKDIALQLAKKDLLMDPAVSPSLKTPNHWSHLILIGNYEPYAAPHYFFWWWLGGAAMLTFLVLLIKKPAKSGIVVFHRNKQLIIGEGLSGAGAGPHYSRP